MLETSIKGILRKKNFTKLEEGDSLQNYVCLTKKSKQCSLTEIGYAKKKVGIFLHYYSKAKLI